ncbi:uncharacterized protein [Palaemon carinicauda]|uniref:uncharacterized protein n=1 Tax=Palaemon carinicauda TaxID=392227 RepID=UPI0035B5FAC1
MAASFETCSLCSMKYYESIRRFHSDYHGTQEERATNFLREHLVLPRSVQCPKCNAALYFREEKHTWYCKTSVRIPKTKKRKYCNYSVSDYKGTFLQNLHLPPWKIILLVNYWLYKHCDTQFLMENLGLSPNTIIEYKSLCSEVTEYVMDNQEPIGGPGITVEIDESLLWQPKYSREPPLSDTRVFGGIERVSKTSFLVPILEPMISSRDSSTLVPLIQKYIKPGSIIISDNWSSYNSLNSLGYEHRIVSHTEARHDTHTQNIESLMREAREQIQRSGSRSEYFRRYLSRFVFIKKYPVENRLHYFFIAASHIYPPQSEVQRNARHPKDE